ERRAETLRALAPHAHSPNEAAVDAAHALALNPRDVPFSILYLADGPRLALAAHSGGGGAVPAGVPPIVLEACAANEPRKIEEVASLLGRAHHGVWGEETREAWVLPVRRSAADAPSGMIVLGVSPRLSFDTRYQELLGAIVRGLAANLAAASAKKAEEELLAREQAARREAEL